MDELISIHAPAWGATNARLKMIEKILDFNPRSRMGSDGDRYVSVREQKMISIHAPAWGATSALLDVTVFFSPFQSTLPHGERHQCFYCGQSIDTISIHAPAWGATAHEQRWRYKPYISIHAPAWGATVTPFFEYPLIYIFQSTLPHGERLRGRSQLVCGHAISIHAPAWGATRSSIYSPPFKSISIHAPAWGATIWTTGTMGANSDFNPRSRMGSDVNITPSLPR